MSELTNSEIQDAKLEAATCGAQPDSQYIEALLEERRGYEIHGRSERVADVDTALADRGYKQAAEKRSAAAPSAPKGRRSAAAPETA